MSLSVSRKGHIDKEEDAFTDNSAVANNSTGRSPGFDSSTDEESFSTAVLGASAHNNSNMSFQSPRMAQKDFREDKATDGGFFADDSSGQSSSSPGECEDEEDEILVAETPEASLVVGQFRQFGLTDSVAEVNETPEMFTDDEGQDDERELREDQDQTPDILTDEDDGDSDEREDKNQAPEILTDEEEGDGDEREDKNQAPEILTDEEQEDEDETALLEHQNETPEPEVQTMEEQEGQKDLYRNNTPEIIVHGPEDEYHHQEEDLLMPLPSFATASPPNMTTSTPLMSRNRKQFNLDVTRIPNERARQEEDDQDYLNDSANSGEANNQRSEEKANNSAETEIIDGPSTSGSSQVLEISSGDDRNNSDINLSSDNDDIIDCDEDSDEGDQFPKRVQPPPAAKSKSRRAANANAYEEPDVDEIVQKLKQQHIGDKKPLVKYLNTPPPQPSAAAKGPKPGSSRALHFNEREDDHKSDVFKSVKKLAEIGETMPAVDEEGVSDFQVPRKLKVELYPHQLYGVKWMCWREMHYPFGGILADEMGLGKTIMTLSVILKGKEESDEEKENWLLPEARKLVPSKTTLVVCPVACMLQWEKELRTKARGLDIEVYHGPRRIQSAAILAQKDVVITSYPTVSSEIPKPDDDPNNNCRSPLFRINWERVVLDEGHIIRNPKTHSALALCRVTAKHRWIVTGTPVHNYPQDFFSLVKFLRLEPFDDAEVWTHWIGMKGVLEENMARLHAISKSLILRRTKEEVSKMSTEMASIPEKDVQDIRLDLQESENVIYMHLEEYAKQQFKNFMSAREDRQSALQNAGNNYVANAPKKKSKKGAAGEEPEEVHFSCFFALITRLRQAAVLPFLMSTMLEEDGDDSLDYDPLEDPVNLKNPVFEVGYRSTKIRAVMHYLKDLRAKADEEGVIMDKVIIVSQWTSFLDIIAQHLTKQRFSYCGISGKDTKEEKHSTMEVFNKNPKKPQVLLLSLVAGGVGLNLIGANHVLFMEPHWNPQNELQAQDRVHRFGQTKPVVVRRFIVNDTIESRILLIQDGKLNLADGVLNSAKTGKGMGLGLADLKILFDV